MSPRELETLPAIKEFKNGAWTVFDRAGSLFVVKVYGSNRELIDKVRFDDYQMAREYLRAFNAVAKTS